LKRRLWWGSGSRRVRCDSTIKIIGLGEMAQMADSMPRHALTFDSSTELAFERTRAAYERTMMSWIRTATSLITFGFSVYKFFQLEAPTGAQPNRLIGPRQFAFALVSLGLISLLLATIEYRRDIRALRAQYANAQPSLAVLLAAFISLLGIIALIAMALRQ
jgi:inner membrane protein YidH